MSRHDAPLDARGDTTRPGGTPGGESVVERLSTSDEVGFPGDWYALNSADHFWFDWRVRAALRQWRACGLPLDQPLRVLDVGGGRGILRDQVEAATAWTVDLVELNHAALSAAAPGRGRHLYYDVRDQRPDLLGQYDAVLMFDVIEHVEHPQPLLDAVARHLRPDGWLLVNVPALQGLFSAYDLAAGHFRRYGRDSLRAELHGGPWSVQDLRYWGLSLVPMMAARKLVLRKATGETIHRSFGPFNPFVRLGLKALTTAETVALPRPPVGSSILLAARMRVEDARPAGFGQSRPEKLDTSSSAALASGD